ncbi:MAG: hypothetical protein HZC01_04685 [Candidatus Kerfeldbacteria bacterium]|nr:hypothetical protein [Candidatus Kerfeldbacteria bacterium]
MQTSSAINKPTLTGKKLRIGWFSFSCCEDSTIVFTELMNDRWELWKKILDIRHARVLQTHNVLDAMDVAFIEGALASQEQVDMVKKIRSLSKKVVAIGACAVDGLPSAQRNDFDPERLKEIQMVLNQFNYLQKVQKLSEVITVDVNIPGCPMNEKTFLEALDSLLTEFNIVA